MSIEFAHLLIYMTFQEGHPTKIHSRFDSHFNFIFFNYFIVTNAATL